MRAEKGGEKGKNALTEFSISPVEGGGGADLLCNDPLHDQILCWLLLLAKSHVS